MAQFVQLQNHLQEFRSAGIEVVALTYDAPQLQQAFIDKFAITIPVLSDVNALSFKTLGIVNDNYQPGEPHWQIRNDGKLMLSIMIRETGKFRNYIYFSPVIWDVSKSGQWMHIASVFDEKTQNVIHYINGDKVSEEKATPKREVHTTRIGAGEIGNWGLPLRPDDSWFAIRNLNGAIDEFAIFSDALTEAEIKHMHDVGRPN